MITVKTTKRTKSVLVEVGQQIQMHREAINKANHEIGGIVVRRAQSLINSGKKTGRVYTIRGLPHQASAPGEAPATITGRLTKSTDYRSQGWARMTVGQTAPYAKFLEDGTRRMAPRPNLIRAINETSGDAVNIYYRYAKEEIK